jgi:hypothetical protein
MNDLAGRLAERSAALGLPPEALLRQHVLDGLLRRLGHSTHAGELVLRGGLLTRMWVGPARRATEDADFLGLFARDAEETTRRLRAVLAVPLPADDGVRFDDSSLAVEWIWQETDFPGARAGVQAEAGGTYHDLQIDVGFGDPLVPAALWVDYPTVLPGAPARVLACRAETLVGWKLHGLFEHGARRWRAKDLHDLLLLTDHVSLVRADLEDAIRVAFSSRDTALAEVSAVVYNPAWWAAERARQRWARFRASVPVPVPADLAAVAARVAGALRPALERLLSLPAAEDGGGG